MAGPRVEKSKGQTDQRVLGLSYKAFEQEFGFKPDDKIEQRHFANTGERLTDPERRAGMERDAEQRKAAAARRAEK